MLARLVAFAVRVPALVLIAALVLFGAGVFAVSDLNVEAYPNPVPPMVEVIVQPEGLGAEEVEKYVTIPLELGLAGMPGLEHTRSQSLFGLSDVKCYFSWSTDYTAARQEVINRLTQVQLPNGVQASLSPTNAIGEIYRYTLEGEGYSLLELTTAENFIIERQLLQVPGVAGVTSFGGETKEYHVSVDPVRLRGAGVPLSQLVTALGNANQSVGGQRISIGSQSYDVRGVGLLGGIPDIESVVIAQNKGTPVRIKDVARVDIGPAPRLGIVGIDDNPDVVQGVVLMRRDARTEDTLAGVHARIQEMTDSRLLPPGIKIKPYYDRGALVKTTTHTVTENMAVGMILVAAILFVFLGNGRAAAITAMMIPLALVIALVGLVASHTSANLLSIGAIDFGIVVDSTVVMIEGIFRHLGPHGGGTKRERIEAAAREVAGPMAFSTVVIATSFLPLFTMTGVSGVIFAPMAKTYALAIGGAIVLALTVAPVLALKFLPLQDSEHEPILMRALRRIYTPIVRFGAQRPGTAIAVALVPLVAAAIIAPQLGGEFMPKLEEGNLWIRATLPVSVSREQAAVYADEMRRIVRGCVDKECSEGTRTRPEVLLGVTQVGRPDDGTDVTGFSNIEIFAPLAGLDDTYKRADGKTVKRWGKHQKPDLVRELDDTFGNAFPGVVFAFSQMIGDNVDEAVAGVKGANSVKVFGPEIASNEASGEAIIKTLSKVPGVDDLGMLDSTGQPTLKITPDREASARYGLNAGDVTATVQAAIGGVAATRIYEGDRFFDLTVRLAPEYRTSVEAIEHVPVPTPDGTPIPLAQIARVESVQGVVTVYREDGQRYTPVKFSTRGRDLASTVEEAKASVVRDVPLARGSRLVWAGELGELSRAKARLAYVLPIAFVLIAGLTYAAVRTWRDVAVVFANLPIATAGGVMLLFATGTPLSISAAMGLVSVAGVAVQDGILVVTSFQRHRREGATVRYAANAAVEERLRPVLMTLLVAMLGLTPAALSHAIGSETQKPLAVFVIGGALALLTVSRLLQSALLVLAHRSSAPGPAETPLASPESLVTP